MIPTPTAALRYLRKLPVRDSVGRWRNDLDLLLYLAALQFSTPACSGFTHAQCTTA